MKTHTPGPWLWKVEDYPVLRHNRTIWSKENEACIAEIPAAWANKDANARLIAAAPELLEALIVALPFLSEDEVPSLAAKRLAEAAIQKAKGE